LGDLDEAQLLVKGDARVVGQGDAADEAVAGQDVVISAIRLRISPIETDPSSKVAMVWVT
jgi:hypothetical protein